MTVDLILSDLQNQADEQRKSLLPKPILTLKGNIFSLNKEAIELMKINLISETNEIISKGKKINKNTYINNRIVFAVAKEQLVLLICNDKKVLDMDSLKINLNGSFKDLTGTNYSDIIRNYYSELSDDIEMVLTNPSFNETAGTCNLELLNNKNLEAENLKQIEKQIDSDLENQLLESDTDYDEIINELVSDIPLDIEKIAEEQLELVEIQVQTHEEILI